MRKLIVSERVTLDGVFDATSMGVWDFPSHSLARGAFIANAIHDSDAYLLGRTTYEMLWPGWSAYKNNEEGIADKLNSMAKYVISSTLKEAAWNNSTILSDDPVEEVRRLKTQPGQSILVHGSGMLVQALLQAGLVDELHILVHPFIQGSGKRLFGDQAHTALELIETQILEKGVLALRYQPKTG
ncbi:dihydrofolate reductase family protein [Deinococcus sp. QL22]|uniref:dihydrofolate reductase family protein n=1 Tax=Deinococcus sp. QL22 TaxID=2939437 RepID=UPI002017CA03|nr:dihydrofolate reductase family protein [Deinococcus sp. QL22]UQN09141.1 dihydrofolate reductase family protein [Deinococcus sp. QL22]